MKCLWVHAATNVQHWWFYFTLRWPDTRSWDSSWLPAKYDKNICLIVHTAYKRAVLILKCFHTRGREVLKLAFCTYVRPLLEFACQIWSPKYMYVIDKIELVQRFFTRKLRGLRNLCWSLTYSRFRNSWALPSYTWFDSLL